LRSAAVLAAGFEPATSDLKDRHSTN